MSKLKIIAAAALIAATFAGCGARSNGKSYVKSRVDLVFDGAQYVKRGETEKTRSVYSNEFIFSYKEIEFTVTEAQSSVFEIGFLTTWDKQHYSSDYGSHLREFLTEEKLAQLSGGALDEDKLWVPAIDDPKEIDISYRMDSIDDLPEAVQAYKDIYDAIWEYLPENSGDLEEFTTHLQPEVFLWLSVPSDDEGNYNKPDDAFYFWDNGYIPVMSLYSKEDIIDWEEVETLVRYKYYTINDFMANKGIKSPVDMSDEDKKLIERDKNSFYPVYYSPASNHVPSTDEMTKEIPRYER